MNQGGRPEQLPENVRAYWERFLNAKMEEYVDSRREHRAINYGHFHRSDEIYQLFWDITLNLQETLADTRIPEGFASPRLLLQCMTNFADFLAAREELIRDVQRKIGTDTPSPVQAVDRMRTDVFSALDYLLSLDEAKQFMKPSAKTKSDPPAKHISADEVGAVDLALITIIEEEYAAVVSKIESPRFIAGLDRAPNKFAWTFGRMHAAQGSYRVVVALCGRPGTNRGVEATTRTVQRFSPRYVLLVGVAGGLPRENLQLGDVVVSTNIYGYEYGKIEEGKFKPRPDFSYSVDGSLLTASKALASARADWHGRMSVKAPEPSEPKVLHGPVASGDKVIDDLSADFTRAVLDHWPKLQAVEMEGAGAAAAIQGLQEDGQNVGFIMVRGISDMPSRDNSAAQTQQRDLWKRYAADTAASYAADLIEKVWPVSPSAVPEPSAIASEPKKASAGTEVPADSNALRDWASKLLLSTGGWGQIQGARILEQAAAISAGNDDSALLHESPLDVALAQRKKLEEAKAAEAKREEAEGNPLFTWGRRTPEGN